MGKSFRTMTPTFVLICPFIKDHRILCKGILCRKIHHLLHAKTKAKLHSSDCICPSCPVTFLDDAQNDVKGLLSTPLSLHITHQTKQYHNCHLLNEQDRHCQSDSWRSQTELNHWRFLAVQGHMLSGPQDPWVSALPPPYLYEYQFQSTEGPIKACLSRYSSMSLSYDSSL